MTAASDAPTIFFRLLTAADKASALRNAVAAFGGDAGHRSDFTASPKSFGQIPGSPFAYWASEALRRKFTELPALEGNGRTVKQGLATADDFRFVRAWWEVPVHRILDVGQGPYNDIPAFQAWCRERTRLGKRWVPFAKGGAYSPYYSDLHLVVNWESDGAVD